MGTITNKTGQVRKANIPNMVYVFIVAAHAVTNLKGNSRSIIFISEDT